MPLMLTSFIRHCKLAFWLQCLACFLVPLARSLLLLYGLSVLALLGRNMAGRRTPLGCLAFAPSIGVSWTFALAVGRVGSQTPLLDWTVKPKRIPRSRHAPVFARPPKGLVSGFLDWLMGCTPQPLWAPPRQFPGLQTAGLFCSPGLIRLVLIGNTLYCASAMTAPFSAFQSVTEEVEYHQLPPQEGATYQGTSWPPRPTVGPTHSPDVVPIGPARPTTLPTGTGPWLAVNVHTPHYRTINVACRVSVGDGLHHVAELVKAYSGGVPPGVFDVVTPVRPLRFPEFAEFIRLPHIIRYQSGLDMASVILDLTRVGGNYFPYSLPRTMGHQAFLDFIQDHIRVDADEVFVFVGTRPRPWPKREPFEFRDGDAVILSIHAHAQVQSGDIGELFVPGAHWGEVNNLPQLHPASGVYILHGADSYFIADYHHSGVGTAKAVADRLRQNLQAITTCSYESHDFDFGGKICHTIFCVADLPWPHADPLQAARRDIFVLCDLRALGKPPEMIYTNHPVLHIPSICARFGLRLPPSYRVRTIGGREVEDEVFIEEHSVIVFTAVPCVLDDTDADALDDSQSEIAQGPEGDHPPSPAIETTEAESSPPLRQRSIRFSLHAAEFINDDFILSFDAGTGSVLGIVLHAPYYQEEYLAIFFDSTYPQSTLPDRIRASEPRLPLDLLECIVPVEPLPDPGFAAYLAYPPILDSNDLVAVLVDLRPAHGAKFAAILPKSLSFDAWDRYVKVLLPHRHYAYDVFLGLASRPMPTGSDFVLSHGLLVQVYPAGSLRESTTRLEDLLANHNLWKCVGDIPRIPFRPGLCLLSTGEQRWYLCRGDYPSSSLVEAVEQCVHATPGMLTVASSRRPHLRDLCLHGRCCQGAVILVHLPPPVSPAAEHTPRQDAFLFVDYRPVGVRPFGFHQIGTTWDLKTILAKVPACIPTGYQIHVEGAWTDHSTLVAPSGATVTVFIAKHYPPTLPAASERTRSRSREAGTVTRGEATAPPAARTPQPTPAEASHNPAVQTACLLVAVASAIDTADAAQARSATPCSLGLQGIVFIVIGFCLAFFGLKLWDFLRRWCQGWARAYPASRKDTHEQIPADKLLTEPTGGSSEMTAHLGHLRALTAALGGRWLRDARPIFPGVAGDVDVHDAEQDIQEDDDDVLYVCSIILKVGHTPEEVCVALPIPAPQAEAEDAVQAARNPTTRRVYPSLLPVLPQPITGNAVFLAGPAWIGTLDGCCFDTTAVDGRLFAVRAPDYLSRHELLSLAHFQQSCDVQVLVGTDQEPLTNENPIHLFPGMLVTFLPSGSTSFVRYTLGQQLQTRLVWSEWSLLPDDQSSDVYCLVCEETTILHFADPCSPTRYRDNIAAAAGVSVRGMRLQAAQPRPTNVALWGFTCRSVIAVYSSHPSRLDGTLHCCLLDCRPLCDTWKVLRVHTQGQRVQDLLPQITEHPPLGHRLRVSAALAPVLTYCPGPGCVLLAEYDSLPNANTYGSDSDNQTVNMHIDDGDGHDQDATQGSRGTDDIDPAEDLPVAPSAPAVDTNADQGIQVPGQVVLLFAQEYVPELIALQNRPPTSLVDLLAGLEHRRAPDSHRRTPRLVPVFPQPQELPPTLLALPHWRPNGVAVLVDCRIGPRRLFAVFLPSFIYSEDLAIISGVTEERLERPFFPCVCR